MEFSKIISITGKPGLFQTISQTKTRFIVESLADKKCFPIPLTTKVSLLKNIVIYTYEKEMSLLAVFKFLFEKEEGKEAISHKENGDKLVSYFSEVLPNYDDERVYISSIKKIIQWYNLLVNSGLDFSKVEPSEENTEEV